MASDVAQNNRGNARPEDETPERSRSSTARIIFLIHSFIGLKLTLILTLALLSGTLSVVSHEIDWLIYPQMRVSPGVKRISPGTLYNNIGQAYPDHSISILQPAPFSSWVAASAIASAPDNSFRRIWINQFTGKVRGHTPRLTLGTFLTTLHRSLFLPGVGRIILNFFGPLILISLITGLITYKRFWRGFFNRPRTRDLRTFLGDAHRLVGIWSIWFALVIGITGTWWFYENPVAKYTGAPRLYEKPPHPPVITTDELALLGQQAKGAPERWSIDALVNVAKLTYPGLIVTRIVLPANNTKPLLLLGTRGEILIKQFGNTVYLNPFTGKIIGARLAEDIPTVNRVHQAMDPIHFGAWAEYGIADLAVKLIWFTFGLGLTGMAASGLVISVKRTGKAARKTGQTLLKEPRMFPLLRSLKPWGGPMGGFKYFNILTCAMAAVMATLIIIIPEPGSSLAPGDYVYEKKPIGPWSASMKAVSTPAITSQPPLIPGKRSTYFVTLCQGCYAQMKFLHLYIGAPKQNRIGKTIVNGGIDGIGTFKASVPVPKNLKKDSRIWMLAEGWDGNVHQNSWPLYPESASRLRKN